MRTFVLLTSVLLFIPILAHSQPKAKTVDERLQELAKRVDEASRATADSASALKVVQDLQQQVADLRQQIERKQTVVQRQKETQRKLDEFETRISNMELQQGAIRMQMAGRGEVAGFEDGFFLQSPNRRFLLRVGAMLQGGYAGKIYSEDRLISDGTLGESESAFLLRRAAVALGGHVFFQQLTYRLELDFGTVDPGPVLDAYAELRVHPLINFRGGRMIVPFGRQSLIHSSQLEFSDYSEVTRAFTPGWDLGAMVSGEISVAGQLTYQLGIFNGAGPRSPGNDNIDFLYAARLVYEPFGPLELAEGDLELSRFKLAFGAAFTYNLARTDIAQRKGVSDPVAAKVLMDKDGDGKVDNVGIYSLAIELSARLSSIAWQNEFFFRREDPGSIGNDSSLWGSYWGVYSQLGCIPFHGNIELAARYSYWEPNDYGISRAGFLPRRVHELAAVMNLYTWKRFLKWQAEYSYQWQRELQNIGKTVDAAGLNQVRLQLQIAF